MPESIFALIGLIVLAGLCGASFTFGCAVVCRWMKWAPINTIVNINDCRRSADDGNG